MFRPRERGAVLLAAVVTLAVLTILGVALAGTATRSQRAVRDAVAAAQADALARSGVAVAAVVLAEAGAVVPVETLESPWNQALGRQALGAGWVEVRIEDAARRLDLTAPELAPAVPQLLAAVGLDPSAADALADWIDDDDESRPGGAERDWYRRDGIVPPNAPLLGLGELTLVRGFTPAALARLAPLVTVAGEHAINPNTASPEVLAAVFGESRVESLLAARRQGPLTCDDLDLCTQRGQHYIVHAEAGVGDIRRAVEATLWAPAGAPAIVQQWRPLVVDDRE